MILLALAPFKVFLLSLHLVLPDTTIEVFEMAFPTEVACYHFVEHVIPAFEADQIEANPSMCTEQTWYYEDGSV